MVMAPSKMRVVSNSIKFWYYSSLEGDNSWLIKKRMISLYYWQSKLFKKVYFDCEKKKKSVCVCVFDNMIILLWWFIIIIIIIIIICSLFTNIWGSGFLTPKSVSKFHQKKCSLLIIISLIIIIIIITTLMLWVTA